MKTKLIQVTDTFWINPDHIIWIRQEDELLYIKISGHDEAYKITDPEAERVMSWLGLLGKYKANKR